MNRASLFGVMAALAVIALRAAEPSAPPSVSKIFNQQLSSIEHDIVPLAEAMPAEKFDFAPTQGEFNGVRTFAQQMKHVAYVVYAVSASVLEEANPSQSDKTRTAPRT